MAKWKARHRKRRRAPTTGSARDAGRRQDDPDHTGPTPEMARRLCPDLSGNGVVRFSRDPLSRLRLNGDQLRAVSIIQHAYALVTAPVGVRISNPARTPGGGFGPDHACATERDAMVMELYNRWCDEMTREKRPLGPFMDVVIDGHACRRIDRDRGKRDGTTAQLVRDGLGLFAKLARHADHLSRVG